MKCGYRFCDKGIKEGRKYCSLPCSSREAGLRSKKFQETRYCAREGCGKVIDGKDNRQRYCGQSCSSKVLCCYPHTKKDRFCTLCDSPVKAKAKFCGLCRSKRSSKLRSVDYSKITLKDLKEAYSLAEYHAKLRGNARSIYKLSGKPMFCIICSYSKHVDICHIKAISEFSEDTVITEVNSINNLTTLCKNHHWEFDNDMLDENSNASLRSGISSVS